MKKATLYYFILSITLFSCKKEVKTTTETLKEVENIIEVSNLIINPINHATFVLEYDNIVVYMDPVGGIEAFKDQKAPSIILITDIHGDHLNVKTLEGITTSSTKIIAPLAVADKLPEALKTNLSVLSNSEIIDLQIENSKTTIEAIPMYNLREEALKFHEKGRGNGYVITLGGERIYVSGDTEDIAEMRALKNIDKAFVCMNLPYTMTIKSAANATLEFKPKQIYPYHYRGTEGFSDVLEFKTIVNSSNKDIEVIQLNWY